MGWGYFAPTAQLNYLKSGAALFREGQRFTTGRSPARVKSWQDNAHPRHEFPRA